ncbi:MAG: tol-pal system protein YbgF [Acidobacteriales bacterium]|nr:tol-pal system protein YbgF [Terriglobales bacterium]
MTIKTAARFTLILVLTLAAVPMHAGTKEQLIQLQTQVQALQDQMARMQTSFDERMGVMRSLVEQTTDAVNRLNGSLNALDKGVKGLTSETASKTDQVSAQVQSLQDSVDELKSRVAKLSKQLEDIQAAQQNLNAAPAASAGQAPPADELYNGGLRDYTTGKYDLAQQEFGDYLKYYPNTELAGNAQFYVADILFKQGKFDQAVKEYDRVLEQFPGGNKTAAAQLKKGFALIELGRKEEAVKELRSLVSRYPRSPEAVQAKERLRRISGTSPGR